MRTNCGSVFQKHVVRYLVFEMYLCCCRIAGCIFVDKNLFTSVSTAYRIKLCVKKFSNSCRVHLVKLQFYFIPEAL
jgi:hypothetical protein